MAQVSFQKGDVIFREGEFGNTMFEVRSGSVGIYVKYGTEDEKKLTELGAGRIFGEMSVVEVYPRSATAVALSDVTLEKVTAAEINEYFGSAPDKLLEIMRGQTRRLRELTADYEEVCKTIAEWKAKDDDGEQKGGLMGALKKFAAIFNESMKYMGSSSAGLYYSPTTIAML